VSDYSYSIDVGDYNQDGAVDIVVGNRSQKNLIYKNIHDASSFEKIELGTTEFDTYDIMFVDTNGDGYLDVIEANSGEYNLYHLNRIPSRNRKR